MGKQKKRLPTPVEAAIGFKVAAANSRNVLNGADHLADGQLYGPARSLAVLALEEAVKARTLGSIVAAHLHGRPPGYSDADMIAIIYSSHKTRHAAGFFQQLAAGKHKNIYLKLLLGQTPTADEKKALQDLANLLGAADTQKQAGFYTDFDPDSSAWATPADATQDDFEALRALVSEFVDETERQVNDLPEKL
ncbi:AbiV family abortive infection protein [Streptomyces sp. 846.5]|nr:AbiV family abortive infection protein [Streptomyces sp. 846.5]TDU05211.1 AbiV family abortive infection protein [Streptomyces sp. 846.5]